MNLREIIKNYSEKGFTWLLNKIPLKCHSLGIMRFLTCGFMGFYWKMTVNNPANHNFYKNYYRDAESYFRPLLGLIEKKLERRPCSFFEAGCNVGSNLVAIAKIYGFDKTIRYFGCDINELAIQDIRKTDFGGQGNFALANIANLGFLRKIPDNSYDVIFTRDVFMFVQPGRLKRDIIKEFIRISNGCILLIEPWKGKDRAVYVNAHILYFEDMRQYLPKEFVRLEEVQGFNDRQVLIVKKCP